MNAYLLEPRQRASGHHFHAKLLFLLTINTAHVK